MSQRVMGMETEYAISGRSANGDCLEKDYLASEIVQIAAEQLVNLPAGDNAGLFLANGSRFYRDSGNHPELSTPECLTPWEVVRYVTAGDHIMHDLAGLLIERIGRGSTVDIGKVNVDYSGTGATWGCHESYSHLIRESGYYDDLIPHLVSRVVYTGAGGFLSNGRGLEFTISPRAHHMVDPVSSSSTSDRGIVHTKNEDLTGGSYNRLHLLCGESLFSQTGAVLKIGSTALVLALLENIPAGLGAWHLDDPVGAMRTIAGDPTCRVEAKLITGNSASALEIQDNYLTLVEREIGADWLPDWAGDLCRLWRQTLDALAGAPESVCGKLDWAVKYVFFEKVKRERGFDNDRVSRWNSFLDLLFRILVQEEELVPPQVLENMLRMGQIARKFREPFNRLLSEQGLERDELMDFLELRRDLFMLDARFNTVGNDCIFAALQESGVLNHEVPGIGDVSAARTEAPGGTRAHIRGRAIKDLAGRKGENLCGWEFVNDQVNGIQLNLSDPLNLQENWEPIQPRGRGRPRFPGVCLGSNDFLELLYELDL